MREGAKQMTKIVKDWTEDICEFTERLKTLTKDGGLYTKRLRNQMFMRDITKKWN
jgi:hypothetical protein